MKHDWVLDVLADLKTFARSNDLTSLAEQLDDTILVAASDIASMKESMSADATPDAVSTGSNFERVGTGITA